MPIIVRLLPVLALLAVAACETMEGVGQDVEAAGETIQGTANDAQAQM